MSHVVSIKCVIKDLGVLEKALAVLSKEHNCELELIRDKKTFNWFGSWQRDYNAQDAAYQLGIKPEDYGKCDHVIRLKGCHYEIGLVKNPEGPGWVMVYDFWGPGRNLKNKFRQDLGLISQRYGVEVAKKVARKKGHRNVKEKRMKNGKIKLTITTGR